MRRSHPDAKDVVLAMQSQVASSWTWATFSTDLEMSTEDMVRFYTDKSKVESQFRQLNDANATAFRPCYHWTDTKIKDRH
jgi:transposase